MKGVKNVRGLKGVMILSKEFIDKSRYKKIDRIKDLHERKELFEHSLVSVLRMKHLDFEMKLKKMKDKKKKHLLSLKSNVLPSKMNLLHTGFNEKDFKKINALLDKLEEEINNV